MNNTSLQKTRIHRTALGGYTIDGPYTKRRGVRALVARVLRFVGV